MVCINNIQGSRFGISWKNFAKLLLCLRLLFFFLKNTSKLQTASSLIRISYNNLCFSKNSSVFCKEINNIQERCATVIMNTKFFSLSVSQFNNSFENFQGYCTEQMFTLQMRETLLQRYVNVIMNTSNQNQLDCIAFVL